MFLMKQKKFFFGSIDNREECTSSYANIYLTEEEKQENVNIWDYIQKDRLMAACLLVWSIHSSNFSKKDNVIQMVTVYVNDISLRFCV